MKTTNFDVEYRLDPVTKGWTATMPDFPAIVTQGRTLKEAHTQVRAALSLLRRDAEEAKLRGRTVWPDSLGLSDKAIKAIREEVDLRLQALELEARLEHATAHAVQLLIRSERQTYRAAGALLGITHQRVEQIDKLEQAG